MADLRVVFVKNEAGFQEEAHLKGCSTLNSFKEERKIENDIREDMAIRMIDCKECKERMENG